jgi:hypothetical protein
MVRGTRIGKMAGLLAVAACLLLPVSSASASGGPAATKSGAIVNYLSLAKLKIAKTIQVPVICSVNCNVQTSTTVKGPGFSQPDYQTASFPANVAFGPFFSPNGPLLKSMKATPGKYKILSSITATNSSTGAIDSISHAFKLKR